MPETTCGRCCSINVLAEGILKCGIAIHRCRVSEVDARNEHQILLLHTSEWAICRLALLLYTTPVFTVTAVSGMIDLLD